MIWIAELFHELQAINPESKAPAVIIYNAHSYATALCLDRLGRAFQPYLFDLGYASDPILPEFEGAASRALKMLTPSMEQEMSDFLRLVGKYNCSTLIEFELGYLALSTCSAVCEDSVCLAVGRADGLERAWRKAQTIGREFGKTLWAPVSTGGSFVNAESLEKFGHVVRQLLDEGIDIDEHI